MSFPKNFNLNELTITNTGYYNIPEGMPLTYLARLANNVLQPIRDKWNAPIIVNSAYRCKELNAAVGGAKNSDHVYGCAADIRTKSNTKTDNKKLFDLIVSMAQNREIECRQIIDEYNYSWVHVSINNPYNKPKKNQILHIK